VSGASALSVSLVSPVLADSLAPHCPAYAAAGSSNGAPVQTSICHRLLALEKKILQRVSIGSTAGPVAAATAAPAGTQHVTRTTRPYNYLPNTYIYAAAPHFPTVTSLDLRLLCT
jgi:hypothetical protein